MVDCDREAVNDFEVFIEECRFFKGCWYVLYAIVGWGLVPACSEKSMKHGLGRKVFVGE